jgi:hypothetical protein
MHPYISLAIAEQRAADMRADAAARRLARAIKAGAAKSRTRKLRARGSGPEVPRQRDDSAPARPLASSRR